MPRDIPVGNGRLLVAFDKDYLLRELYFPHVGEESHTRGEPSRLGVWVDGRFSWLGSDWKVEKGYLRDCLVTEARLHHGRLGISIVVNDLVDFNEDIFLRRFTLENLRGETAEVRLFLGQDLSISGNDVGDTACFRPEADGLLHYKGDRYFLSDVYANKKYGIEHFACGNKGLKSGQEGTWKDAEDGVLSGNPAAQGAVDSVLGIHLRLDPGGRDTCFYWISAGRDWAGVSALDKLVRREGPETLFSRTRDYWSRWVDKEELDLEHVPEPIGRLYNRSLLILRTQIDHSGAIIAGNDSDVLYYNRDTYSYMWPRDAALTSYALDLAGYPEITARFFSLCARIIEKDGYLLHKYTPAGLPASSWHSWISGKKYQLPIQEDETALVLWALWNHYKLYKDIELIRALFNPLIRKAADFLADFRDPHTGLPLPCYDLWEERWGICTYTAATVWAGLTAAERFCGLFGEAGLAEEYRSVAADMRRAMDERLYLEKEKRFCRMIGFGKDGPEPDKTVDASLYGLFAFGAYGAGDEKVASTMAQVQDQLWCQTRVGGIARYAGDAYYRQDPGLPGNPWIITTLWRAQYLIASARTQEELRRALETLSWAVKHALPSGCLAEQVHPHTAEPLSVSPLTWSHATFIMTVQEYINKLLALDVCAACHQPKYMKKRIAR